MTVTRETIEAAAARIRPHIVRTPMLDGSALRDGLWLKAESLQRGGSFKVRGAFNAVLQLPAADRKRGVITLSAGNHGVALALVARTLGIPCAVVLPDTASRAKADAIASLGAELIPTPPATLQERLETEQARRELCLVHPFDDPGVIDGQGTVGLEILEAVPDLATLVVPIGGGGLISGIAVAIKASRPGVSIVGVEPERACVVSQSLRAGRPVDPGPQDTVAEGLAPPYTRPRVLSLIQQLVDEVVLVSEAELLDGLRSLVLRARLVVEPSGAAAVAALKRLGGRDTGPLVAVVSGSNVDPIRLASWLSAPVPVP